MKNIINIDLFYSILSGALLTLAFPKAEFNQLAWIAIVPLLFAMHNLSLKQSFKIGLLSGFVHYLTLLYWLIPTMHTYGHIPIALCIPALMLLSIYLACYTASFTFLARFFLKRNLLVFPFFLSISWVALEYIRSFSLSGFPWAQIGYSQFSNLNLIQIADIGGVYSISFLIIFTNATIFLILLCFNKKMSLLGLKMPLIVSALILVAMFGSVLYYGDTKIKNIDKILQTAPVKKISIVQGNIDQSIKWDTSFQKQSIEKYIDLSLKAQKKNPDLIVWPETALPFYFLRNIKLSILVIKSIKQIGTFFLVGSPALSEIQDKIGYFNSAYLINPEGRAVARYDKSHLVPFGEYNPLKTIFPFLGTLVDQIGDFKQGVKGETIQLGEYKLGVQICFEIIFPNLSRQIVKNNASVIINLTNDAWFGTTGGPYQHFSMSIFRAVENRRSLVRSANTGISGFVDPLGRVCDASQLFTDTVLTQKVPLMKIKTFYTLFGDIFAQACTLFLFLAIIIKFIFEKIKILALKS